MGIFVWLFICLYIHAPFLHIYRETNMAWDERWLENHDAKETVGISEGFLHGSRDDNFPPSAPCHCISVLSSLWYISFITIILYLDVLFRVWLFWSGWIGSVSKNMHCSDRGPEFGYQCLHPAVRNYLYLQPEGFHHPLLDSKDTARICPYKTYRHN